MEDGGERERAGDGGRMREEGGRMSREEEEKVARALR